MNCKECKKELNETDKFCSNCGFLVIKDADEEVLDLDLSINQDEEFDYDDFELELSDDDLKEIEHVNKVEEDRKRKSTAKQFGTFLIGLVALVLIISLVIALGPLWIIAIILLFIFFKR